MTPEKIIALGNETYDPRVGFRDAGARLYETQPEWVGEIIDDDLTGSAATVALRYLSVNWRDALLDGSGSTLRDLLEDIDRVCEHLQTLKRTALAAMEKPSDDKNHNEKE